MAIVVCTKMLSENRVLDLSSGVDFSIFSPFIDEFSHDRARSGPNDCNWGVTIPQVQRIQRAALEECPGPGCSPVHRNPKTSKN